MLLARLRHEVVEELRLAGGGLDLAPGGEREIRFGTPIYAVIERGLGDDPLLHAGDVRGGDVDEVRPGAAVAHRFVEGQRAEEVRLKALVDRRVEGDLGGAVEDDVEVARKRRRRFREVALHDLDALVQEVREAVVAVLAA